LQAFVKSVIAMEFEEINGKYNCCCGGECEHCLYKYFLVNEFSLQFRLGNWTLTFGNSSSVKK